MFAVGCGNGESNPEKVDDRFFGINAQYLGLFPSQERTAELEPHLSEIAGLGVDFVRSNVAWSVVEPVPPVSAQHTYDFSSFDPWVAALARAGLRWQPSIVPPVPGWAADRAAAAEPCGSNAPPSDANEFARFAGAIAARYGRNGTFWGENPEITAVPVRDFEIWNEPNFGDAWCPLPDPARFAGLYAASREAIRAEDDSGRVMVGGLSALELEPGADPSLMSAGEFLSQFREALPSDSPAIDVIGVHPYAPTAEGVLEALRAARLAADEAKLNVPLAVNEVGWPTRGPGGLPPLPEETRAAYLGEITEAAPFEGCNVTAFAPHTWTTPQRDQLNPEDWFGIAEPVLGNPYQTAVAYGDAITMVAQAGASSDEAVC